MDVLGYLVGFLGNLVGVFRYLTLVQRYLIARRRHQAWPSGPGVEESGAGHPFWSRSRSARFCFALSATWPWHGASARQLDI